MSQLERISASLLEKTKANKLRWDVLGSESFYTEVGDLTIIMDQSGTIIVGRSVKPSYELSLRNVSGREVENIKATSENYDLMRELYEAVRRKVLNVDEKLNELEDFLSKI